MALQKVTPKTRAQASRASGRPPGRKLSKAGRNIGRFITRWSANKDIALLCALAKECRRDKFRVSWDRVAKWIGPNVTGGAIEQHVSKLYSKLKEHRRSKEPRRKKRKNNHDSDDDDEGDYVSDEEVWNKGNEAFANIFYDKPDATSMMLTEGENDLETSQHGFDDLGTIQQEFSARNQPHLALTYPQGNNEQENDDDEETEEIVRDESQYFTSNFDDNQNFGGSLLEREPSVASYSTFNNLGGYASGTYGYNGGQYGAGLRSTPNPYLPRTKLDNNPTQDRSTKHKSVAQMAHEAAQAAQRDEMFCPTTASQLLARSGYGANHQQRLQSVAPAQQYSRLQQLNTRASSVFPDYQPMRSESTATTMLNFHDNRLFMPMTSDLPLLSNGPSGVQDEQDSTIRLVHGMEAYPDMQNSHYQRALAGGLRKQTSDVGIASPSGVSSGPNASGNHGLASPMSSEVADVPIKVERGPANMSGLGSNSYAFNNQSGIAPGQQTSTRWNEQKQYSIRKRGIDGTPRDVSSPINRSIIQQQTPEESISHSIESQNLVADNTMSPPGGRMNEDTIQDYSQFFDLGYQE